MSTLFYTGLGVLLSVIKEKLNGAAFELKEASGEDDTSIADLYLIGPDENNPIKLVQKINSLDNYISIIILTLPAQFSRVKQTIQFAPFVGKNTLCIAYTEDLDFRTAFKNASLRTRQRRSFSKLNKAPSAVTSIASSTVKVDNFGIFLEQAPIGALLIDEESRIIAINQKAKQFFNAEEQKLYVLKDFFPALSLQQLKISLGTIVGQSSKVVEANNLFLELSLSEVKNDENKALNILLVNDVTEQKRKETELMESEALFRFMAEAMPQKVWTANANGDLNFFNQHWIAYTGKSLDELKGWGWIENIHSEDAAKNREAWQKAIDTGVDFELEQRILRQDGAYRWHLVRGVPRKDSTGKVLMWVGTNTDIHEQKAFVEELENRVKERTFELEKINSDLEQFVYVTSHDLQEPLRKIRMFSEMLKDGYESMDAGKKRHVDKISATALRMSTLLRELLNFTQMSKEEQFEPTDLNQIIAKALVDLELIISQKTASVQIGKLPTLNAIPVQMHQLFYNLINNALKFSKADVLPLIQITSQTAEGNEIRKHQYLDQNKTYCKIIVEDNGIGFDQNYAEQIFHIFQRLHNRTEYSGTGIGLALCKKIVTNHFGVIYAKSEKGNGASFHILLPFG